MREGTTWRVMVVDRTYDEFYDFYSVSSEYFGFHHVYRLSWGLPQLLRNSLQGN
jgi:hypothetical protein